MADTSDPTSAGAAGASRPEPHPAPDAPAVQAGDGQSVHARDLVAAARSSTTARRVAPVVSLAAIGAVVVRSLLRRRSR